MRITGVVTLLLVMSEPVIGPRLGSAHLLYVIGPRLGSAHLLLITPVAEPQSASQRGQL